MSADCFSYNHRTGSIPEVVLPRPWFMEGTDRRLNGVPVDACLADTVLLLWENRVVTEASCCGHGKRPPGLVLGSGEDAAKARRLVGDGVELHQWQLVEVEIAERLRSVEEGET